MPLPEHETLQQAAKRYRLRDPGMHNSAIAERLNTSKRPFPSHSTRTFPGCFFYVRWSILEDAAIVAVRVTDDELAILAGNEYALEKVTEIADEIMAAESEETHA